MEVFKMNEFKITIANLGLLNEGEVREADIHFPCDELEEIYNHVTFEGSNDYIITDYEADFPIGDFESLSMLQEISEMKEEQYEVFLTIAQHDGVEYAVNMVDKYEFRVWTGVKDWSDIAYQMMEDNFEFQNLPDVFKRHFDFEGYGEELESCSNGYWDTDRKIFVEVF